MNSQMTGYPSIDKPWEMFCQKIEYSFKKYSNKVALRLVGTENPCTYTYGELTAQMQKYRLVCRELGIFHVFKTVISIIRNFVVWQKKNIWIQNSQSVF